MLAHLKQSRREEEPAKAACQTKPQTAVLRLAYGAAASHKQRQHSATIHTFFFRLHLLITQCVRCQDPIASQTGQQFDRYLKSSVRIPNYATPDTRHTHAFPSRDFRAATQGLIRSAIRVRTRASSLPDLLPAAIFCTQTHAIQQPPYNI